MGSLASTDVLGAVMGSVAFLLACPGDWLLLRIQETNAHSTADLLAISSTGEHWIIEFKGTAPLSTTIGFGKKHDTCARIHSQRLVARAQVEANHPFLVGPPDGQAITVTALADAGLTSRTDILPVNTMGCPPGKRCTDVCFASSSGRFSTCPGIILWKEAAKPKAHLGGQVPIDTSDREFHQREKGVLALMQLLQNAAWADLEQSHLSSLKRMLPMVTVGIGELRSIDERFIRCLPTPSRPAIRK